ncbi:zinc finger, C2H2, LYAR-type protein [Rhodotorula toruloides]|uniref:Zinc finger, C2H2, LYAR-type protein n=1 Tax=Rhodotorula toruloides TaxID=5286 RepID=A0A511KPY3_RHOTO|nr:zinc finger, C2H2, LYAR-type protein [Rhodotorula toruloides]
MVSFSCEGCGDILKKGKLDQHAQRCRNAEYTCIDCNTTFLGTSYRSHTSCITEEEKYQKSVYKPPKGKKGKQQNGQQAEQEKEEQPVASTSAAPAVEAHGEVKEKKRARDEQKSEEKQVQEEDGAKADGEPAKKKKKKSKKNKETSASTDDSTAAAAAAAAPEPATNGTSPPSLASFLTDFVTPLLKADENVSLASLRQKVVEAAKEKGIKESEKDVEAKLWEGLKVGGKKGKVRVEFA